MPRAQKTETIETDFVVIGTGVAGLRAAIGASLHGKVIILNKADGRESNSEFAQGGIAAALHDDEAAIESHFQDTMNAGAGLCRGQAVRAMVEDGPRRIEELLSWGVRFDKIGGRFAMAKEGAHSERRILRAKGDATGNEIVQTLVRIMKRRKNILVYDSHFAVDLLIEQGVCLGAWALDEKQNTLKCLLAQMVILATGGAGQVYQRTTNPPVATGDGIAMALRAGALIEDMEFFQFHPTALSLPSAPSFLLSETMRGEGGLLRDADGKLFMDRYHPDAEMAPRDIVTRAVWEEMHHRQVNNVFLDMTHLKSSFVRRRFPKIYATCLHYGIDLTKDPIPVAPSAHYAMGGVKTDLFGRTTIERLSAAGEVACTGAHGANRLASNSLLEALVFGARVGEDSGKISRIPLSGKIERTPFWRNPTDTSVRKDHQIQKEIKETMWCDVGIIRNKTSLQRMIQKWQGWKEILYLAPTRSALETRNMLLVSAAITEAALRRKESIGAHFRDDFPNRGKRDPKHISISQNALNKNFPLLLR